MYRDRGKGAHRAQNNEIRVEISDGSMAEAGASEGRMELLLRGLGPHGHLATRRQFCNST
jgi:hypothetical protein